MRSNMGEKALWSSVQTDARLTISPRQPRLSDGPEPSVSCSQGCVEKCRSGVPAAWPCSHTPPYAPPVQAAAAFPSA